MYLWQDFPIFHNNPGLVYLDSASSTQKPQYVIEKTSEYITQSYANIGRWSYSLADQSDEYYYGCKQKIAGLIHCKEQELFFSHNASYCINSIWLSLIYSNILTADSEIILSISEHHANILIRQQLAQKHGLVIKRLNLNKKQEYDLDELGELINSKTKLICLSACSNVLWIKNNLNEVRSIIGQGCLFLVDGSQAIPNYPVDVQAIDCDFLVRSAHKFLAYTGLGVGYIKNNLIAKLKPGLLGWWTIQDVTQSDFVTKSNIEKFEPWTPNIIAIVSLFHALDYRNSIGGYKQRMTYEKALIDHFVWHMLDMSDKLILLSNYWLDMSDKSSDSSILADNRIWLFSFIPHPSSELSIPQISQELSSRNICVRSWGHCAYPLSRQLGLWNGSIRASLYIYNTTQDIDRLFAVLKTIL